MAGRKMNKKAKPVPVRVAVLDGNKVLVGEEMSTDGGLEIGDLPCDGSYKWDPDHATFVPMGFGFGKPAPPPVGQDHMLFLLVNALVGGKPIPVECTQWRDWYRDNLQRRVEERRG